MSEQSWLVIRCPSCLQCSGHRRQKGRCPHCGSALDGTSEVVKVCTSGGELLTEVALANTPSELRDELRARLSSKVPEEQTSPISMRALLRKLRDIADEEGVVDVDSVSNHLRKNEVDAPAEGLMEQAEVEGLVLRLDETRWMFFE